VRKCARGEPDRPISSPQVRKCAGGGLLFMAFNTDVAQQFEFTQSAWADNAGPRSRPPSSRSASTR
jgi:hypothetical protein